MYILFDRVVLHFQVTYSSCACILGSLKNDTLVNDSGSKNAYSGICKSNCKSLAPFLIVLFVITLLTAINQMPMLMVTLRSVNEIEKPFALGLQLVILRLLGKRVYSQLFIFFLKNFKICKFFKLIFRHLSFLVIL